MPKNGFVMRFFGCAQLPVGVVGAERSIHLSYGRKYRCLFRRARGRGISFRLLCRRTLYPPAEGKNLLAKVHPSYGRKYRCLFRRAGQECRFCYLWQKRKTKNGCPPSDIHYHNTN